MARKNILHWEITFFYVISPKEISKQQKSPTPIILVPCSIFVLSPHHRYTMRAAVWLDKTENCTTTNSHAQMPNCEKSWSPLVWNSHNYLPSLAIFMDSWNFPICTSAFAFQVALTCRKDLVQLIQSRICPKPEAELNCPCTCIYYYPRPLISTKILDIFIIYFISANSEDPSHDISWAVIFIFSTNFVVFSTKKFGKLLEECFFLKSVCIGPILVFRGWGWGFSPIDFTLKNWKKVPDHV